VTDKGPFSYNFSYFIITFFNFLFPSDNNNYVSVLPVVNSVAHSTSMLMQNTLIEQACKCHGCPIDFIAPNKAKWTCPINSRQLAASDITDTAVRIGEQTVLFLPTSEGGSNLRRVSTSITFDVIERTELASMNEGTHDC
jgi:hypothetical protein